MIITTLKHLLYKSRLIDSLNRLESSYSQAFWKTLDGIKNVDSEPKENNVALGPAEWLSY